MSIHEVFPYLRVRGADAAIRFYREAFGCTEKFRLTDPSDGRVGHAELEFAPGVVVMVSDEYPEYGCLGPASVGGAAITLHVHVDDCDAVIARAVELGAEVRLAPRDQFYGERSGTIVDPYGYEWNVGHSIETDVDPAEMQRRWDAASSQ